MIALVCALAVVLAYQYWLREIYFYREPVLDYGPEPDPPNVLYSPVQGRVVYVRKIRGGQTPVMMEQKGRFRQLPVPQELVPDREYYQIGIFMTPFNNHHLLNPTPGSWVTNTKELDGALERMWDAKDDLWMLTGKWWMNWWEKKLARYLSLNRRTRFFTSNGIVMDLIYDKYVSQFNFMYKRLADRVIIGFVGRGSQVDMFIPADQMMVLAAEGERVDHTSWLGLYTE